MLSLDASLFSFIGELVIYFIIIIIFLVLFVIGQLIISMKKHRFLLPRFQSFLLDLFHPIIRALFEVVRMDPSKLDILDIKLKNIINEEAFSKTPVEDRIVVLPQCLRSIECPAQLSSKDGIQCIGCGLCNIEDFKKEAEQLGYMVYIVPGGTFVRRIIEGSRPQAVLGVGCFADLIEGMKASEKAGIVPQGVLLETLGCIETVVNWDLLREKLYLGLGVERR